MLLPIAGLVVFSVTGSGRPSLATYAGVFADPSFQAALLSSLAISALSVLLCIVLLTPTVWYAYLHYPRLLTWVEGLSFIPFVLPPVVLGLGYVQFFSAPPLPLAGTPDLLPFAFTLLGMPYYVQSLLSRMRLVDVRTFHDAAQSLGSSGLMSLLRIQIPILRPGILSGAAIVFSIGMGEFAITQLTTGGSYVTLPIYLQVMFQNNPVIGSAVAVLSLVVAILGVGATLSSVSHRRRAVQAPGTRASRYRHAGRVRA